ncbi:hypothetical protein IF129_10320 [Streptomyces chumphonensis]|uniref:Uncharacterized protein n=1 Tax=Streptomyces chumphonensis TaxID=1214925 RepID=A0A927ICJ4_9ACTN|nr:hypothetical protein [Streptomyces chumphonensis]MBD3931950.1 hypothetical protein [Streptomyces chumphonensis]
MTAFPIGYEVACDGPDEARECPASAAVRRCFASRSATEVREDGRAQGWTRPRRAGRRVDVCPDCRKP